LAWLADFNRKNPDDKVDFLGFDFQEPNELIESLLKEANIADASRDRLSPRR
jgi:hypothetical protein